MTNVLGMAFPFLSSEWMDAARAIRAKYQDQAPKITAVIRINQVITDVPFGDGTVKSYMDTSTGQMEVELGELENPDATVTTDWATARAIFAMNDQAAAMQAFMGGKIKVAGSGGTRSRGARESSIRVQCRDGTEAGRAEPDQSIHAIRVD